MRLAYRRCTGRGYQRENGPAPFAGRAYNCGVISRGPHTCWRSAGSDWLEAPHSMPASEFSRGLSGPPAPIIGPALSAKASMTRYAPPTKRRLTPTFRSGAKHGSSRCRWEISASTYGAIRVRSIPIHFDPPNPSGQRAQDADELFVPSVGAERQARGDHVRPDNQNCVDYTLPVTQPPSSAAG